MTTSIVTGAAGFIGSHVCDQLLKLGHTVIALDDLSGGKRENVPDGCQFWRASILSSVFLDNLFNTAKPDYVFHLAAYAAEGLSHYIRRFNYTNNLIGSVNLINAAVNVGTVRRFVFASSAAVYGQRIDSDDPLNPVDPYGIAKLAVEMDLKASSAMFGLDYTAFRMHNVYGERQNLSDPYRNVVGIFMRQCLQNSPMTIYGDGEQTRQFTYVGDIAPVIVRSVVMDAPCNQVLDLGSDRVYSVNDLAWHVGLSLSVEPRIHRLPERPEVSHVDAVHEPSVRLFGHYATTLLADGLSRMADWARTQTLAEPRQFENIEIEQGLPAHWRVKP